MIASLKPIFHITYNLVKASHQIYVHVYKVYNNFRNLLAQSIYTICEKFPKIVFYFTNFKDFYPFTLTPFCMNWQSLTISHL
jgi:hypothetical protein